MMRMKACMMGMDTLMCSQLLFGFARPWDTFLLGRRVTPRHDPVCRISRFNAEALATH